MKQIRLLSLLLISVFFGCGSGSQEVETESNTLHPYSWEDFGEEIKVWSSVYESPPSSRHFLSLLYQQSQEGKTEINSLTEMAELIESIIGVRKNEVVINSSAKKKSDPLDLTIQKLFDDKLWSSKSLDCIHHGITEILAQIEEGTYDWETVSQSNIIDILELGFATDDALKEQNEARQKENQVTTHP